jgi:hypothetical protein
MALGVYWVIPGMILLAAMTFGGVHLWIKRRREAKETTLYGSRIRPEFEEEN